MHLQLCVSYLHILWDENCVICVMHTKTFKCCTKIEQGIS